MKYMLDECITIFYQKNLRNFLKRPRCESVLELLGAGTKDHKILEYSKAKKYTVITYDKKFIQELLKNKIPVVCVFSNGDMIEMKKIGKVESEGFKITEYLLKSDSIIIP